MNKFFESLSPRALYSSTFLLLVMAMMLVMAFFGPAQAAPVFGPAVCIAPETGTFGVDHDNGDILFIVEDCDPALEPHQWRMVADDGLVQSSIGGGSSNLAVDALSKASLPFFTHSRLGESLFWQQPQKSNQKRTAPSDRLFQPAHLLPARMETRSLVAQTPLHFIRPSAALTGAVRGE